MSEETDPFIPGNLDGINWVCFETCLFFKENNITAPIQHGVGGVDWSTVDNKKIELNVSDNFLKIDNCDLSTEYTAHDDSDIHVIGINFDNVYIHIWHNLSKQYLYRYLVSKQIVSKEAAQTISDGYFYQNTYYYWTHDMYFPTGNHLAVYYITYYTLVYAHHKISIAADKSEYKTINKRL